MGRILITNNQYAHDIISNDFDFMKKSFEYEIRGNNITSYKKIRINNKNFFEFNDGFIIGTGTYFYKGLDPYNTLIEIINDSLTIEEIKNKVIGSYCIVLCKNNKIDVFINKEGNYNMYYTLDDNNLIITNTYYHIAKVLKPKFNKKNFILERAYILKTSTETIYNEIKRFNNETILHYNGVKWEIKEEHYKSNDSFENIYNSFDIYKNLGNIFKNTAIFQTGGSDSRLALGLMNYIGMSPTVLYGEGDSLTTCTKENDKNIVKLIADKKGYTFQLMNWKDSNQDSMSLNYDKYGELANAYGYNENFLLEFERKINTELLIFGYFGECYRNIEEISAYKEVDFSLEQMINDLYINNFKADELKFDYIEEINELYNEWKQIIYKYNLNELHLQKKDFILFDYHRRNITDIEMNNLANMFFYSFPLLGEEKIINTIYYNVDFLEKNQYHLMLKLIEFFDKDLLDIPFFSHIKQMNLNKNSLVLEETASLIKNKEKIKLILAKHKILKKFARKIYFIINSDKKGLYELKKEQNDLDLYDKISFSEREKKYLKEIHGLNSLKCLYEMIVMLNEK